MWNKSQNYLQPPLQRKPLGETLQWKWKCDQMCVQSVRFLFIYTNVVTHWCHTKLCNPLATSCWHKDTNLFIYLWLQWGPHQNSHLDPGSRASRFHSLTMVTIFNEKSRRFRRLNQATAMEPSSCFLLRRYMEDGMLKKGGEKTRKKNVTIPKWDN